MGREKCVPPVVQNVNIQEKTLFFVISFSLIFIVYIKVSCFKQDKTFHITTEQEDKTVKTETEI